MTEIKGQLLGIILLLTIFGTISVGIASVFKSTKDTMVEKATDLDVNAEEALQSYANA